MMAKQKSPIERIWGWVALAAGAAFIPVGLAGLALAAAAAAVVYMLWFAPMRCRAENRPDRLRGSDPFCRNPAYGLLNGCRHVPGHGQRKRELLKQRPWPWWLWRGGRAWAAIAGTGIAIGELSWAGAVLLF